MKRALVTGAGGFIGRHCLGALRARGFEVHAAGSGDGPGTSELPWHRCNLLDAGQSAALLKRVQPTHLLHLAWVTQPGAFWTSPANQDWLQASAALLQGFYGGSGLRAVVAGSCAEYAATDAPAREDSTPVAPQTPYGSAKARLLEILAEAAGKRANWAWARLYFPYGPGEPDGRFIPSIIDALLRGEAVACTHGRQVRDFVYVEDAAQACAALLAAQACGAYNVGSGKGRSLREVAAAVVAQLGRAHLVRFGEREAPAHDLAYVVADVSKIRAQAGWSAQVPLEEGLRRSIAARSATAGAP